MARQKDNTENKNLEIALTLSGGGYRASIFHIGVLSYLDHLTLDDGSSFLDNVTVMSTVSGGTITGMLYLLSLEDDGDVMTHLNKMYHSVVDNNLAEMLLKKIDKKRNDKKLSVIKELGNVYDDVFFRNLRLGKLFEIVQNSHVHHYAAYATDISNAMPFRFQVAKEVYGNLKVGNDAVIIEKESAHNLRLADVMAASSCFPIAFEPINYPRDFIDYDENDEAAQSELQTMLMDGGIVDNQGVDYLLEANRQMTANGEDKLDGIDVAIISDAASSTGDLPDSDVNKVKFVWWKRLLQFLYRSVFPLPWLFSELKFLSVKQLQMMFCIVAVFYFVVSFYNYRDFAFFCIGYAIASFFCSYLILICLAKHKTPQNLKSSNLFAIPKDLIWNITFNQYYRIISKRYASFSKVVSTVMMGHIRKKNMEMLETNSRWTNRFVIPCIQTLTSNGCWKSDKMAKTLMASATDLMKISDEASNFHSTLWFSQADNDNKLPQKILACGQFSICYELYLWILKHSGNQPNMPKVLNQLKAKSVKKQLEDDWKAFKVDPYMLTGQIINT